MTLNYYRERRRSISLIIDLISYRDAISRMVSFSKSSAPGYFCFANVHMVIEAHQDNSFADQVNHATMVLPDGMPLVKTLDLLYGIKQDRVAGMDIMPDLIARAKGEGLKLFFFGTTQDMLDRIRERIEMEHPGTIIAGMLSPPFDRSLDDDIYIKTINDSGANLVFVALGCPKQEKWMAKHSQKINAVLLGVGGAFPVYAGVASRAPEWMRNMSLEWVYRLFQEPGRLFKRYFFTNSLFIFLVFKAKIGRMFGR